MEFAMFTGVRQAEALGLSGNRVDRARGVVLLNDTKNGEPREVQLGTRSEAVLARRQAAGATTYVFGSKKWDTFRIAWENALVRAGVTSFRFHDLRHTCASWMIQQGRPLTEVRKDIKLTLRYAAPRA